MDKLEFIAKQLSRAKGKVYENYVITRIWHLLNDLSIKFVTQQYIKRPTGRALTDMYFPQLRIHIEVDEAQHKDQVFSDKMRELDIIDATGHEILRIDVTKPIELVNNRIDEIVEILINSKNNDPEFKPWNIEAETNPQTYIDKGFIELSDNCSFRTMVDAANCFGNCIKPKGIWSGGANHPFEENKMIWFPKLYHNDDWNNSISLDEKTITEISADQCKIFSHIDQILDSKIYNRIIFARVKGPLGDIMYRFKGEYELNLDKTSPHSGLIWERTEDRVKTYPHKC